MAMKAPLVEHIAIVCRVSENDKEPRWFEYEFEFESITTHISAALREAEKILLKDGIEMHLTYTNDIEWCESRPRYTKI